jgi:hypothetical protein
MVLIGLFFFSFYFSGTKHLEEIMNAGYEMPAVNQIEVRALLFDRAIVLMFD